MHAPSEDPVLYVFAISHYCEKARWTLDYLGIDYALVHLPPGTHAQVANELGAPTSSLPILAVGETVIQGSDAIFDWASAASKKTDRRLEPDVSLQKEARLIEQRLDAIAGVQTRRYFYSEALVEHPEIVLPVFAKDLEPDARDARKHLGFRAQSHDRKNGPGARAMGRRARHSRDGTRLARRTPVRWQTLLGWRPFLASRRDCRKPIRALR